MYDIVVYDPVCSSSSRFKPIFNRIPKLRLKFQLNEFTNLW